MAYTINQGYSENHSFDNVQRGLLVGLPALALILSFGAWRHNATVNNPAGENAKVIPIVSSLLNSQSSGNGQSNGSSGQSSSGAGTTASTASSTGSASGTSPTTAGSSTSVGGMGGGP